MQSIAKDEPKFREKQKFTAVYNVQSPAHWAMSFPMLRRFEKLEEETMEQALEREGIVKEMVFILVGWPLLHGEPVLDPKLFKAEQPKLDWSA